MHYFNDKHTTICTLIYSSHIRLSAEVGKSVFKRAARLFWVCAVLRRRFSVGESPTRQLLLQPEAIEAVMGATSKACCFFQGESP